MKVLHIVKDEKFIDSAYELFEQVDAVCNDFWCFSLSQSYKFKYVKKAPIQIQNPLKLLFKGLLSVRQYDIVFVHWLGPMSTLFIHKYFKDSRIIWIGWGGDYYDILSWPLLSEKTKLLKNRITHHISKENLHNILKKNIFFFLKVFGYSKLEAIAKLSGFAPVLDSEYKLVKKIIPNLAPYFDWNYGDLENHIAKGLIGRQVKGNNILFGNSADLTGNHIDLLDLFDKLQDSYDSLYIPLSYGNMDYAKIIKEKFDSKIKNTFFFDTFLPLEEYLDYLCSCKRIVMNHYRQQGYGNIIAGLYLGMEVYLNPKNPLYVYLKEHGFKVFSLDELVHNKSLSDIEIRENKSKVISMFSHDTMVRKTKSMLNQIAELS